MWSTRAAAAVGVVAVVTLCGAGCDGLDQPQDPSQERVTSRWVGTTPDGMIVEEEAQDGCPAEYDLELNLSSSATSVTGSATTRLRRVEASGPCGNVLGGIHTYSLFNGVIDGDRIAFTLGTSGVFTFAGTFTASRMTGSFAYTELPQTGRFAVNRQ